MAILQHLWRVWRVHTACSHSYRATKTPGFLWASDLLDVSRLPVLFYARSPFLRKVWACPPKEIEAHSICSQFRERTLKLVFKNGKRFWTDYDQKIHFCEEIEYNEHVTIITRHHFLMSQVFKSAFHFWISQNSDSHSSRLAVISLKTVGSSSSIEGKHRWARFRSLRSSCLNVAHRCLTIIGCRPIACPISFQRGPRRSHNSRSWRFLPYVSSLLSQVAAKCVVVHLVFVY